MALDYGFYNSIDGDRKYDAIQFGRIFDGIITDGVYGTYLKGMQVKASSNPNEVIIQPGRAWFNHTWSYVDSDEIFDFSPEEYRPEVILDRIDALVLDINTEQAVRKNSFMLVKGDPASQNPQRPTAKLIKSPTHNQYPLAYIYRKAGTTQIYAEDITNMVGTSECPFVTGVLEGIDLDAWINQWDAEFHRWENATVDSFESWMVRQQGVYTAWYDSIKDQMEGDLSDFEAWFETIKDIIDEETATHLQAEIDALSAMLPAGSHITITTNEQSLYLRNVTVSDVAGHSATAKFDSTGVAVVESFPYIGSLTVTSTNGTPTGTATEVISVPYFGRYNVNLAFWSATVNLNGDSSAAGIVVKVKDHSGAQLTTVTLNASGKGVYTASFPDTYKFEWTSGGETMEVSLNVTEETTYSVEIYAGFNWRTWCNLGGVSTYGKNSLSDVFADEVATRRLMTIHASADYLIDRVLHKLSDIDAFCANDTAMKWIGLRDYVCDGLTAISGVWAKFLASSYWEKILKDHVPVMTSNTAPYGTASDYKVFDNSSSTTGTSATDFSYKFTNPICVKKFTSNVSDGILQGSNDESTWISISTPANNTTYYMYYRVHYSAAKTPHTIQFYGRSLNVSVPVMTSNTAPFGEAISSTVDSSSYAAWKAFDGVYSSWTDKTILKGGETLYLGYNFSSNVKIKIKQVLIQTAQSSSSSTQIISCQFKLQSSDDGSSWTDETGLLTLEKLPVTGSHYYKWFDYNISNGNPTSRHRLLFTSGNYVSSTSGIYINNVQFYGVDYSEREFASGSTMKYLYDHGVELETASPVTVGNNTVATKNEDNLYIEIPASTNRYAGFVFPSISLSPFSLLRGVLDDIGYSSNSSAFLRLTIENTVSPTYGTTSVAAATFYMSDGVLPNNLALNISSINQNGYPSIGDNNASGTVNKKVSVNELWIE